MAPRLQMKLGVVPEANRLHDAPDSTIVVEPAIGSVLRTKGQLYLLVTSGVPGARVREATRLVAETIRDTYYYDESAGVQGCLSKALVAANRRLSHARERSALGHLEDGAGPVGVALAVVRGNELYVATVGPAEAYLIRGARLSTLPDPHRDRGLPASDLVPDVWRGEISVGDQLVLISPNLVGRLGPTELKDAMVTLHPQSAIEHLHHRFVAADGTGSDGAIAIEAAEVAMARSGRQLVPVRPSEPLAGAPDRSPIPLADTVSDGVAAAQAGARRAGAAIGGRFGQAVMRLQELLPRRAIVTGRVRPISARREQERRAAIAILAFVVVFGGLGVAVYAFGGRAPTNEVISSAETGQAALDAARAALDRVQGPGVDLVTNDPRKALQLLTDVLDQLDAAAKAGIPSTATNPLKARAVAALDRLYGMVDVSPVDVFNFPADTPVNLTALVRGPDGAPYVIDAETKTVFRVDTADQVAVAVFRDGTKAAGGTEGEPRFLAVGGRDLLILDANNVLWRWRPADNKGTGSILQVKVIGAAEWGSDVRGIGTFLRNADAGLYNLYVIDPSAEQILAYSPAQDGSGFPAAATGRLATTRDVSAFSSLYIDGDIFVADDGTILRFYAGKDDGWTAAPPGDTLLRPAPAYELITSDTGHRTGLMYAWDRANARVVAIQKVDGSYVGQYRLAGSAKGWDDIRGWYAAAGVAGTPDDLVWITSSGLHRATLESPISGASPSPSAPGTSPNPSQAPSPSASAR
jgi:hypothetical protein